MATGIAPSEWVELGARAINTAHEILEEAHDEAKRSERKANASRSRKSGSGADGPMQLSG